MDYSTPSIKQIWKIERRRRVWKYISCHPTASLDVIAAAIGCKRGAVRTDLGILEGLGYIGPIPEGRRGAPRPIFIPMMDEHEGRQ